MKTFELFDRIHFTSRLLWVYQSMEIDLHEFSIKNPAHPRIKDVQARIDLLKELHRWIVINYESCETLQRASGEWQKMCLSLTKENELLKSENDKLLKQLNYEQHGDN